MQTSRRRFLGHASSTTLALAGLGSVGGMLSSTGASAAETSGYRALVCVFLYGGVDNHDIVLPYDSASYEDFAQIRGPLLQTAGASRSRGNLLELSTPDPTAFGARRFALPPELARIKTLYDRGHAAIVGNVGPLLQPTDKVAFEQQSVALPPRLFSHNDQQAMWQASEPEGARVGWGGRFADAALAGNAVQAFATIGSNGDGLFLTGRVAQPYSIDPGGAEQIARLAEFEFREGASAIADLARLRRLLRSEAYAGDNLLARDIGAAQRRSIDNNARYNEALASTPGLLTVFPTTALGEQLRAIAEAINARGALGASRQLFFVGLGGFDTHSTQARLLPALLAQLDGAVSASISP